MSKRRHKRWYLLLFIAGALVCLMYIADHYAAEWREAAFTGIEIPERVKHARARMAAMNAQPGSGAHSEAVVSEDEIADYRARSETLSNVEEYCASNLKGADRFIHLTERMEEVSDIWTGADFEALEAFHNDEAALLDTLHQLFQSDTRMIKTKFMGEYVVPDADWAVLRDLGNVLELSAYRYASSGDWEACIGELALLENMGRAIQREPFIIAAMLGGSSRMRAVDFVAHNTTDGDLSLAQYDRLLAHWTQPEVGFSMSDSLMMEISNGLDSFGAGPASFQDGGLLARFYRTPIGRTFYNFDISTYADWATEVVAIAEMPYYEGAPQFERLIREYGDQPFYRPLSSRLISVNPFRSLMNGATIDARTDLFLLGLAVERHNALHGTYPESLSDVGEVIGGVPVDPFSGAPFRYSTTDDGFTLYSIGPDLEDDGGRHNDRAYASNSA